MLMETAMGGDPDDPQVRQDHHDCLDADFHAAHAEWLNEDTARIVDHLRRLDKADRDHIMNAITTQLLEAR